MLDSARLLTNVCDVNNFTVVKSRDLRAESAPVDFYVQLWQSDLGLRYIVPPDTILPPFTSTLKVEFLRADTVERYPVSQTVMQMAVVPFATDRSIWRIMLADADVAKIVTGGFRLTLTEGTAITTLFLPATIHKLPSSATP